MHEQSIIDKIISCLNTVNCRIIAVSLICSEQELIYRLQKDVTAGIRTSEVIKQSIQRISLYRSLNTIKVNTSGKSAADRAGSRQPGRDDHHGGTRGIRYFTIAARSRFPQTGCKRQTVCRTQRFHRFPDG